MIDLAPCPACRRHVRVDETACPFCAAPTAAVARELPAGRFARAVVFAGAIAGAAAGCGGKAKPAEANGNGSGSGTGTDSGELIGNEAAAAVDAGVPDAQRVETLDRGPYPDETCCMPYGAPPARARLV